MNLQASDEPVRDFIVFDDGVLVTGVYNWLKHRRRTIGNDILFHYNRVNIQAHRIYLPIICESGSRTFVANQTEVKQERNTSALGAVAVFTDVKQAVQDDIEDD